MQSEAAEFQEMKFFFISTMHGFPWGGSEELWSQAATELKRAGHEVRASVEFWPRLSDKVTALAKQVSRLKPTFRSKPGEAGASGTTSR